MSRAEILNQALMAKSNGRDTYQRLVDIFGPVMPLAQIVEAEQSHHLPASQRRVEREGAAGIGPVYGRRRDGQSGSGHAQRHTRKVETGRGGPR